MVEEKFGFNTTTAWTFITDLLKNLLLDGLFLGAALALAVWLYGLSPEYFWLIAWGAVALFNLFMDYFYSELIVPLFNKQTPLEEGALRTAIEDFAEKVDFPIRNIYVIDSSKRSTHANAYFAGFGRKKRVVLYDTLIQQLSTDEIVGVLAHEIGHYKHRDTVKDLAIDFASSLLTFWLFSLVIDSPAIAQAAGCAEPSFHLNLAVFSLIYIPLSMVLDLAGNAFSRKQEREADEFAAYTPLNGYRSRGHHHCWMHTNCCNANGPRGFLTVLRGLAQAKGADVFLNFYVSGSFKVKVPDLNEKVAFRTYSRYPKDGDVQIRYVDTKARKFALNLRIPETWAKVRLELNGETRDVATTGYLRLDRTWKPGDWITLTFEQPVAKHVLNNAVAFTRGPLLLVRASRFADGDIASPIDVTKVDAKALSSFVRVQSDDPTLYALFSANLPIGLHTSDPDNGNLLRSVRFCDYASAANAWTPTDYCRSWIPVVVHGKTF